MTDTAPSDLDRLDPAELALIETTAAMYAAVYDLSDAELNALFDAVLLARGQAAREHRQRLVAYFERTGEWLLNDFTRRGIPYSPPRRQARVTPRVRPQDGNDA